MLEMANWEERQSGVGRGRENIASREGRWLGVLQLGLMRNYTDGKKQFHHLFNIQSLRFESWNHC